MGCNFFFPFQTQRGQQGSPTPHDAGADCGKSPQPHDMPRSDTSLPFPHSFPLRRKQQGSSAWSAMTSQFENPCFRPAHLLCLQAAQNPLPGSSWGDYIMSPPTVSRCCMWHYKCFSWGGGDEKVLPWTLLLVELAMPLDMSVVPIPPVSPTS